MRVAILTVPVFVLLAGTASCGSCIDQDQQQQPVQATPEPDGDATVIGQRPSVISVRALLAEAGLQ